MKVMLPFQKQPKIFAAFKAGYETVSKHFYLVLFPIVLDLFLLFGFRITIVELMQDIIQRFVLPPSATPDLVANWELLKSQSIEFFRYFSLTAFLRSFPVGIPSLFSVAAFERNPLGEYQFIHLQEPAMALLVVIGSTLIGLIFAYLLYRLTGRVTAPQSSLSESTLEKRSLISWLWIPVVTLLVILFVLLPAVLVISLIGALLPIFTTIGYFFLTVVMLTLLLPVFFTPHLIVLEKLSLRQALAASFSTVRLTNARSTSFIFLAILTSYLTNMLWRIPADDSWMLLVSIFGHALISIVILAASFHYISDARRNVRTFLENQVSETNLA